jgi:hypothetical protein
MTPDRRRILEQVANGELTPEDAEALLSVDDTEDPPAAAVPSSVRRVRVVAGFGAMSIVGDPEVREAEVDGIHTVTMDGDTLVISAEMPQTVVAGVPGAFTINIGRRGGRQVRRVRTVNYRHGGTGALHVRINPSLELDAKLDAGPLSITGITAPIRARASAGPITIDDAVGPMDVAVNAGAIRITGRIDDGESRVRSDAGGIRIELDPSSSVRVVANAALGKVVLPGMDEPNKGFGSSREATIGSGAGSLRVETAMGSIHVSTAPR